MSTVVSVNAEKPLAPEEFRIAPILGEAHPVVARTASQRDEQMQALVEQLFFRPAAGPVR